MVRICLDAGHGGQDAGATGNDLKEKDLNLDIIKRLRDELLTYEGVELLLTRDTDVFVELTERAKKANLFKADLFISVHINAHTSADANGFETYIFPNAKGATKLHQQILHQRISARVSYKDLGMKQANFAVLRETAMSAVLTENGFISNAEDAKKLSNPEYRQQIAIGHAEGIAQIFGLKKKANPVPVVEEAPKTAYQRMVDRGLFQATVATNSFVSYDELAKILEQWEQGIK